MSEKCQNCKCFLKINETSGICRRYPPKSTSTWQRSDGIHYGVIPDLIWIDNDNWCGEWRAK